MCLSHDASAALLLDLRRRFKAVWDVLLNSQPNGMGFFGLDKLILIL